MSLSTRWIGVAGLVVACSDMGKTPPSGSSENLAAQTAGLLMVTTCTPSLPLAPPSSPGPGNSCRIYAQADAGAPGGLLLRGTVLAPNDVYMNGEVLVDSSGVIACIGCNCSGTLGYGQATRLDCAGSISPGLINTHEHLSCYSADPTHHATADYEHRHQWRPRTPDPDGHTNLSYACDASTDRQTAAEMRHVLSGTTSLVGREGVDGLARNLDRINIKKQKQGVDQREGMNAHVVNGVFPFQDGFNELNATCSPGVQPTRYHAADATVFHIGEGISAGARNELDCGIGGSLDAVHANGTIVHGTVIRPAKAQVLRQRGAWLSWSPRSNIELYGDTAPVTMLDRMGVGIALGTDWSVTGSINLSRELVCARQLNATRFGNYFSDFDLWRMVTTNAAFAAGVERKLGMLKPGYLADIAIFDGTVHTQHSAVVRGEPKGVALVLRGGQALYGDAALLSYTGHPWLDKSATCAQLPVCSVNKRACISSAALATVEPYLVYCGTETEPNCSPARTSPSVYPGNPATDSDGDGVVNGSDKCPSVFNPIRPIDGSSQANADGDSFGDACDTCPLGTTCTPLDDDDLDADGIPNGKDNCPNAANASQADFDVDGFGDACDCSTLAIPCELPIEVVRDEQALGYPGDGAKVKIRDLYVTAVRSDGFFAQRPPSTLPTYYEPTGDDPQGAAKALYGNAGLFVFTSSAPSVVVGNKVDVTGTMKRHWGLNELSPVTAVTVTASGALPFGPDERFAYKLATFAVSGTSWTGELADQYEGMLVKVVDQAVVNANPDVPSNFNEFEVLYTGQSVPPIPHGLRVDDYIYNYNSQLSGKRDLGDLFTQITGILIFTFDNHKLAPRSSSDITVMP